MPCISYINVYIFVILVIAIALIPYAQREERRWLNLPVEKKIEYYKDSYKYWCCTREGECRASGMCFDHIFRIFDQHTLFVVKTFINSKCRKRDRLGPKICNVTEIDRLRFS